jgi:hypothetical protein
MLSMEVYRFRHIYEHAWFGVTKVKVEIVDIFKSISSQCTITWPRLTGFCVRISNLVCQCKIYDLGL